MTVGIVGLGLIGESAAKAYKVAGHTVYSYDPDINAGYAASLLGASDARLTEENLAECELVLLCAPPSATVNFIRTHAAAFKKDSLVIDFCGVKKPICEVGFEAAEKHDRMIAYTSQLTHVISNALLKSPVAAESDRFYGKSLANMIQVAKLNEGSEN